MRILRTWMGPVVPMDSPATTSRECASSNTQDLKLDIVLIPTHAPQDPESSSNRVSSTRTRPLLLQTCLVSTLRYRRRPTRAVVVLCKYTITLRR